MGWIIVVVVAVTALSGAAIGSTKGREWEGAVYGLFFSVFGLVVVAAMPASPRVQQQRDQALARAIVEAMAASGASTPAAPAGAPSADTPAPAAIPYEVVHLDDAPSVTVGLAESAGVASPSSTLTLTVAPGVVVVAACRAECTEGQRHRLVLTDEEAAEACQRLRIAAVPDPASLETTGAQNADLLIDWTADEADGARSVCFDWTGTYLEPAAIARWESGDRPDEADCGTLYLSDSLTAGGELDRFESALSECAHLALEWEAGRANLGYVRATLSAFGTLLDT